MIKINKILCSILLIAVSANTAFFINPCSWDDETCILSSSKKTLPYFVNGIPELGIPPADPLEIDPIDINVQDLGLFLQNVKIFGLGSTEFIRARRDASKESLHLELKYPIHCTGKYKVEGKFASFDIFGDGDYSINVESVLLIFDIHLKRHEKNGKTYFKIGKTTYEFEPIGAVSFKLENLYNGDESKAKPVMDILNATGRDILKTYGKPVVDKIVHKALSHVKKFFDAIPSSELEISKPTE